MIGSTIKVVATAENGNTFDSDPTDPVDDGIYTFDITSAKAKKVNEIEVTFADAVDSENVTFAVTKGTESVPIEKVEATDWSLNEDGDVVVTLKTSANMTKGTYTVTATDSVTSDTDSADFEVTKQEVARIEIKNTKAYTNASDNAADAHTEAYAYYDVFDQYDQSIRSSASIQWAGSCEIKADKANGMLTLKKTGGDKKAWVYGEKIYITGVYTKTGAATSETLTVDTEQSLDTIDVVGFLKKGTSDIIEDLPEDFKTEAYYMLFHALDQNGCPLKADQIDREDVTFLSDSPLVVKEVTFGEAGDANKTDKKPFTVKGEEYNAVYVNPGIDVAKGGDVTVTAIANKTGKKTDYNFWVGPDAVVDSFDIGSPSGVVADGDSVEIPFTAAEADGTPITNFKQLAKQEIFNTLSFTTSEGKLRLAETNDRKAKLTWTDEEKYYATTLSDGTHNNPWSYSVTTDDIDRPVSLTAIVVGGQPDNEMLYVQDKRRPNSIAEVKLDDVYVEGAGLPITLNTFKYYDQYGKVIGTEWGDNNGFFAEAKKKTVLKNTDFSGYTFGVRIEYAGTGKIKYTAGGPVAESETDGTKDGKKVVIESGQTANYSTTTDIKSVATGEGFKFEIAKFKDTDGGTTEIDVSDPDDWDAVSPSKYKPITVVDITQVKNFTISDLNMFYTGKLDITGDKIINADDIEFLKDSDNTYYAEKAGEAGLYGLQNGTDYRQEIVVKGTYGTSTVTVPHDYYTVSTTKGSLVDDDNDAKDTFDTVGLIKYTDLYDKTTANGNAKLGQDEVVAEIIQLYGENENTTGYWILELGADNKPTGKIVIDTTGTYKNATDANKEIADNRVNAKKVVQSDAANEVLREYEVTPETTATSITQFISDNGEKTLDQVEAASGALRDAKDAQSTAEWNLGIANSALKSAKTKEENAQTYANNKATAKKTAKDNLDTALADYTPATSSTAAQGNKVTALNNVNIADPTKKSAAEALWGQDYNVIVGGETVIGKFDTTTDDDVVDAIVDAADAIGTGDKAAAKAYLKAYRDREKAKADTAAAQTKYDKAEAEDTAAQAALTTAQANVAAAQADYDAADKAKTDADNAVTTKDGEYKTAVKGYAALEAKTAGDDFDKAINGDGGDVKGILETNRDGKTTIPAVYDTAKKDITYSDQAPYAADITGLKDSYIFNPTLTVINGSDGSSGKVGGFYDADQKKGKGDLKIVDQYGVAYNGVLEFTISNAVEDKDGYAENNFKVSDNGTNAPTITGAEIGDTFDLVVSVQGETLKKTTKVTVGADTMASIVNGDNNYNDFLKKELEKQRKAGLQ